ncbi:DNA-binding response regulator, partial [bacterium]|nr:DNA-binding response regulator [bacterium]
MTTNTPNETVILFHSGSGKLAQLLSAHLTSRNVKNATTLREAETLIYPTEQSHIVVIDWDSWDDGEDTLTRLRSRHYVIPIIVVGTEISHSQTLDLLRLQVNDVILSLEPNNIIQSLNRIFSEFAVISLSNIFMYSTRRYKALSHMNSAMDALLDAIKSLRLRHKDTEFQSAIKQLP